MTNSVSIVSTTRATTHPGMSLLTNKFVLKAAALLVASLAMAGTPALAQFVGPTPLTLVNGWTNAPFGTSNATVEEVNGIVQFRGAIAGGTNATAFTLPASLSPASSVYVQVDMCNATKGRLYIQPNGTVTLESPTAISEAQCFTSLDGASFVLNRTGSVPLPLTNGWTSSPFGTGSAVFQFVDGIVHFAGAVASGTTGQITTLPAGYRPGVEIYIPITLCNSTEGRLFIQPSGVVTVQSESAFSTAQCFTSLDGAWFVLQANQYQILTLTNGWTNAPFGTGSALVENVYGVVYFAGAIATSGTNTLPFTLPPAFRPVTNVYVPIDLCNATKGRLNIQPSGVVAVQAESSFSNAQCFTSLDGASFVQ